MVKELELKEPSEPEFESGCQPSEPSVGIRKGVQPKLLPCTGKVHFTHGYVPTFVTM